LRYSHVAELRICRCACPEWPASCGTRDCVLSKTSRPGERALVAVSISAELPRGASIAVAGGGSSRPARGYQRATAGNACAHRRGPRQPASALTSSRRPARLVGCLPRPDRVPGDRDRGRATFAPSGRGASLRRQCPERCGTAGETSLPPARHRRRQIAQQLRPVPRGRLLRTGPPRRPAPATRRRDVQPNAEPARGRRQAGDASKRAPPAQGRRQQRRTSPRPARSPSAKR
jgi:hypothetical protein